MLPDHRLLVAATAFELPQLALLAGVLVLTLVMLAGARRRRRDADESPREFARRQIAQFREDAGLKSDMGELIAELHEASRRLSAQLDTKAARLEALLRDADARIARFEALASGRALPPAVDVVIGEDRTGNSASTGRIDAIPPESDSPTSNGSPPARAARSRRTAAEPAGTGPAAADSAVEPTPSSSAAREPFLPPARRSTHSEVSGAEPPAGLPAPGQRRDEVYALADAGRNVVDIARATGLKPGEIELLLALRAPVPDAAAKSPARRPKR